MSAAVLEAVSEADEVAWRFHPDRPEWVAAGVETLADVLLWQQSGGTQVSARLWLRSDRTNDQLPMTVPEALAWIDQFDQPGRLSMTTLVESFDWRAAGFSPTEARSWRDVGYSIKDAGLAVNRGDTPEDLTVRWDVLGLPADARGDWLVMPPETAGEWLGFLQDVGLDVVGERDNYTAVVVNSVVLYHQRGVSPSLDAVKKAAGKSGLAVGV